MEMKIPCKLKKRCFLLSMCLSRGILQYFLHISSTIISDLSWNKVKSLHRPYKVASFHVWTKKQFPINITNQRIKSKLSS